MSYLGSKSGAGVFQAVIALMPPHDTYVELFAGTGAVLLRKPPAVRSIAVDLNADVLASIPDDYPGLMKHNGDAFSFIDAYDYAAAGRTLIYADPPYLLSTRTSSKRYRHELTEDDHKLLLLRLMLSPAQVIISGYPSPLYDQLLSGWQTLEFQSMTRGGVRTERLWFNFKPSAVHWTTHAGSTFGDRQRIKRKAERWAKNYAELPPGERLAVLAALLSVDGDRS